MATDPRLDDTEWLNEQYWNRERSLRDIAAETGTSDQTVRRRLIEHGLGTRDQQPDDERLDDPEWLKEQYWGRGRGLVDIAEETETTRRTVRRRLLKYGIGTRRPGRPA